MIIFQRVFKLQSGHESAWESIKGEITQKVIKRELSFSYATYHHDLFYITVKYHQNIPKGILVIEWTGNVYRQMYGRTNARFIAIVPKPFAIFPEPFSQGIKISLSKPYLLRDVLIFHDKNMNIIYKVLTNYKRVLRIIQRYFCLFLIENMYCDPSLGPS